MLKGMWRGSGVLVKSRRVREVSREKAPSLDVTKAVEGMVARDDGGPVSVEGKA